MRLTYDPSADAGYAFLSDDTIEESTRLSDRVIADYDAQRRLVGVELLDASTPLDVETLRALPKARKAFDKLHDMAMESRNANKASEADTFLGTVTAFRGTLSERRLKVAAHAKDLKDPALRTELARRGVITQTARSLPRSRA